MSAGALHVTGRLRLFDLEETPEPGGLGGALGEVGAAVSQVARRIAGALGEHPEGHEFEVLAFNGEEAIDRLYHFEIDISADPGLELESLAIGRDARLELLVGERSRLVHGIVAEIEALGPAGTTGHIREVFRITLVPRAHLMTLRRNYRAFQQQTVESVIRAVLLPYFIPIRFYLRESLPARPYCCQLDENDFDFIRRIAAEHGMFLFFEQPAQLLGAAALSSPGSFGSGGLSAADALGKLGGLAQGRSREVLIFSDNASAYAPMSFDGGESSASWLAKSALGAASSMVSQQLGGAIGGALGERGRGFAEPLAGAVSDGIGELASMLGDEVAAPPTLFYKGGRGALRGDERAVLEITRRRGLRPTLATYSAYDPRRPNATFRHEAREEDNEDALSQTLSRVGGLANALLDTPSLPQEASALTQSLAGHRPLEQYAHGAGYLHPEWDYDRKEPERMLRVARGDRDLILGQSVCPWLTPGHLFELSDHPSSRMNRRYVAFLVRHRAGGQTSDGGDDTVFSYQCSFECAPSETAFLGRYSRPQASSCVTATVVGGGQVHTEESGMIEVRFHWDRAESGGGSSHASTCWLRVMQQWAGAGFGAQYIPRVGTEVVVGFEAGDPDRPLVMGGLYNATHPPPFPLPAEATKSGIRTQSVPRGETGNELSFEDASDRERIYLHATRDLDVLTQRDRTNTVRGDDLLDVTGKRSVRVEGPTHVELTGAYDMSAAGGHSLSVDGPQRVTVKGESSSQVDGARRTTVSGNDQLHVEGRRQTTTTGDVIERTGGSVVSQIGSADAPRSFVSHTEGEVSISASKTLVLAAEQSILLRCGNTTLRLSPDQAELSSPTVIVRGADVRALLDAGSLSVLADDRIQLKAGTILLKSSGAALGLSGEASLDGSRVLLNSPQQAEDSVSEESPEPTIIQLFDDAGEPIADQPYRIVLEDGREIGGTLDENGRAELTLEQGGDVFFPGLRGVGER